MEKSSVEKFIKVLATQFDLLAKEFPECPEREQVALKLTEAGMWAQMCFDAECKRNPVISDVVVKEKGK